MAYKFRTPGPWGPGQTTDLDPVDVDYNFWQAIQDIAAKAQQGVGIANILVVGNQLTFVMTDHTIYGPFTMPVASIQFVGEWLPNHAYVANDIFTHGGSTYIVRINHTSQATFDPGQNDGFGHDFYGLLLTNAANTLPLGGVDGAFLRKVGPVDFSCAWGTVALTDMTDVVLTSPNPTAGEVLTFTGSVWRALPVAAASIALSQLSDVTILESPALATGQLLTWDGNLATWINAYPHFDADVLVPVPGQIITYSATGNHWKNSNTADIPIVAGINVFGSLSLDYSQGSVQRVVMTNGVTLNSVTNWPPPGQFGRLLLEIRNTGAYTWTWPSGYRWPGGAEPIVSVNGRDIYALTSFDGGSTIDGSVIGQNYM